MKIKMLNKKFIGLFLVAAFFITNANAKDLLISNAQLIDGTGWKSFGRFGLLNGQSRTV